MSTGTFVVKVLFLLNIYLFLVMFVGVENLNKPISIHLFCLSFISRGVKVHFKY